MKRDKIISIRVNSALFERFKKIVSEHTKRWFTGGKVRYQTLGLFKGFNRLEQYTPADLFEEALFDFISRNESNGA